MVKKPEGEATKKVFECGGGRQVCRCSNKRSFWQHQSLKIKGRSGNLILQKKSNQALDSGGGGDAFTRIFAKMPFSLKEKWRQWP